MKKIGEFVLVLIILISLIGCKSKEEKMLDYMEKKYGEEFVLGFAGGRGNTLIVQTIPKRYLGTPKERDKYYRGQIFYERNDIGDDYGAVLLKESTNEYFRPKLEKLFGKNILIALDLEGQYFYADFVKEMNRRKENRKIYGERGAEAPLSGGIYIFGRVESEEDREKYRRGIYEFIQYLKQEGMFEYVDMTIYVMDERYLSKEFDELGIQDKLLDNYDAYVKTRRLDLKRTPKEVKAFIERKKKIYSEIGEKYIIDSNKINEIPRYQVIQHDQNLISGILYLSRIVSEKTIKTNYFLKDRKIKEYDKLEDVDL